MVEYDNLKAVWNMDEAVCRTIHSLKNAFILSMKDWNLENAYWTVRQIRMEAEAKFTDPEQKLCNKKLKELEKSRKECLKDKEKRGELYLSLESYYVVLNRLMKKHALYFREQDDSGL